MKITIDLEEIWTNEDSISDALKSEIQRNVTKVILEKFEKKAVDFIEIEARKRVEELMHQNISIAIKEYIKNGKMKSLNKPNTEVPVEEYIKEKFLYGHGWNSFDDQIKKLSERFAKEMKDRYDMFFASQIVIKMQEQGLISQEVLKAITVKKES